MRRTLSRLLFRVAPPHIFVLTVAALALAGTVMFATTAGTRVTKPVQSAMTAIKTNRSSYLAGDTITISGSGFAPLESVMLQVKHADGTMERDMGHEPVWVYPDADGKFETTWSISIHDAAGTKFVISANGASGETAQAAFSRTATIGVNPFRSRPKEAIEITTGGFNPNELVKIQIEGKPQQTVRTDENGSATLAVNIADLPSETVSIAAQSALTDLVVVSSATVDFTTSGWFVIVDNAFAQDGASCAPSGLCQDDVPLEKDLTLFGRKDTDPTKYQILWSWNSVTSWTGVGQTGNACALFDTDGDSKINFVVCAAVSNDQSNPSQVKQVVGSPYAFTCSDSKS